VSNSNKGHLKSIVEYHVCKVQYRVGRVESEKVSLTSRVRKATLEKGELGCGNEMEAVLSLIAKIVVDLTGSSVASRLDCCNSCMVSLMLELLQGSECKMLLITPYIAITTTVLRRQ